jgi:hypothetical protein
VHLESTASFLTAVTGSNWQTINIRVYHRDKGKKSWGYFAINEKATAESYKMQDDRSCTLVDGQHLRIHFTEITEVCLGRLFGPFCTYGSHGLVWIKASPTPSDLGSAIHYGFLDDGPCGNTLKHRRFHHAAGFVVGSQEAQGLETAAPDSGDRSEFAPPCCWP